MLKVLDRISTFILIVIVNIKYIFVIFPFGRLLIVGCTSVSDLLEVFFVRNFTMDFAASGLGVIFFKVVTILFLYLLFLKGFFLTTPLPLCACIRKLVKLWYIVQLCSPFFFTLSFPPADDMTRWIHLFNKVKNFVHWDTPIVFNEETVVFFDDDQGKDHIQCHHY